MTHRLAPITPEPPVFVREHPFTRVLMSVFDEETGRRWAEERWRPGVWALKFIPPDDATQAGHAMGRCRFVVHGEYKPNGYPTRVFFTQTFIDPDGKEMNKGKLRIKVKHHFEKQLQGIGFEYEIDPSLEVLDLSQ